MDRQEALKLLRGGREGVREWNQWYAGKASRGFDLAGANLKNCDLSYVVLAATNLRGADLSDVFLSGADMTGVLARGASFRNAWLNGAKFGRPWHVIPEQKIPFTIRPAVLRDADFRDANLTDAEFLDSDLRGATLSGAALGRTVLACGLSETRGLDEVRHVAPSTLSVRSILGFKSELPEKFLRGCGVREEEIAYFRALLGHPIRFYSCFISYSTADEEFATRLHNDFQAAGIRCWKWDHDARTGKSMWGEIDQAIRVHEKLVLIASESALKSPYVNREIERAIRQEDEKMKRKEAGEEDDDVDVLFPVRVDDYILEGWEHERKADVTKKVIADARGWNSNPEVYARVRDRLIRDLKREPAPKGQSNEVGES